jgi:hypothetical protein
MSNNVGRSSRHQSGERHVNLDLGDRVEGRGCFTKEKDGCNAEHGSRNGDSLALSCGQAPTCLAKLPNPAAR